MIAEELINQMIPPLKMSDPARKAIIWMEELRCNQLPVIRDNKFQGLISEEIILENDNLEVTIESFDLIAQKCYVSKGQHFFDIIKKAADHDVQLVGVVDSLEEYFGVITVNDTITSFAQTAAVQAPGGLLILSMNANDYSLAEIARLVESNNAKILSSSIKEDELNNSKIKLTVKINQTDLTYIIATLERFGYKIIAKYQETGQMDDQKERLDILMKYLDI